jgi:hypothetical protein
MLKLLLDIEGEMLRLSTDRIRFYELLKLLFDLVDQTHPGVDIEAQCAIIEATLKIIALIHTVPSPALQLEIGYALNTIRTQFRLRTGWLSWYYTDDTQLKALKARLSEELKKWKLRVYLESP